MKSVKSRVISTILAGLMLGQCVGISLGKGIQNNSQAVAKPVIEESQSHKNQEYSDRIFASTQELMAVSNEIIYTEGTEIIKGIKVFKDGELVRKFVYKYLPGEEESGILEGFDSYDSEGNYLGTHSTNTPLDVEQIILQKDADPEQIEEWLQVYNDESRIPVAIFETGIDVNHNSLTHKLWKNPKEKLNGIDDDGNGWVDEMMGWYRYDIKILNDSTNRFEKYMHIDTPNINQVFLANEYYAPLSHGTHVASIAFKDLDKFALVGLVGDMLNTEYLRKIGHFIKDHNIQFANLSFGFAGRPALPPQINDAVSVLKKIIYDNPQTLFFVAAGNHPGGDLESGEFDVFPVEFAFENILAIGSLNTSEIVEKELPNYEVDADSCIGVHSVDIFAPGRDVIGALNGGGFLGMTGTSMASPYALNSALKIYEKNPNLNVLEIKEIIIKTAYIKDPDNPFPCVSGGSLYPTRALNVADLLKTDTSLTIDEAVKMVKAKE